MFPGTTTKLSEGTVASTTSITATSDIVYVTGTTDIATIIPHFGGGFSGLCIVVPTSGAVNLLTTGNIAIAVTAALSRATVLVYSKANSVWYPGAIS